MFKRKREITDVEKSKIIIEYLNAEHSGLCAITDPIIQDTVSRRIRHIQDLLNSQSKKHYYLTKASKE